MLNKGELRVTILEDGRVKTETGDMSGPSHNSADEFLTLLATLLGGEVTETKLKDGHHHHHDHAHGEAHHHH